MNTVVAIPNYPCVMKIGGPSGKRRNIFLRPLALTREQQPEILALVWPDHAEGKPSLGVWVRLKVPVSGSVRELVLSLSKILYEGRRVDPLPEGVAPPPGVVVGSQEAFDSAREWVAQGGLADAGRALKGHEGEWDLLAALRSVSDIVASERAVAEFQDKVATFSPLTGGARVVTELTEAQERVLGIVKGYIEEHGYAPSTRDVMRAMGTSSTNGAHDHLAALKKKGYLTWDKGVARSIRVIGPVDPGTVSYKVYRGTRPCPSCEGQGGRNVPFDDRPEEFMAVECRDCEGTGVVKGTS